MTRGRSVLQGWSCDGPTDVGAPWPWGKLLLACPSSSSPLASPKPPCCSSRGQDSGLAPSGRGAGATEAHKASRASASLRCWCGCREPRVVREPREGRQSSPGIRGFVTAASPGFQPHQAANQTRGPGAVPFPEQGRGPGAWPHVPRRPSPRRGAGSGFSPSPPLAGTQPPVAVAPQPGELRAGPCPQPAPGAVRGGCWWRTPHLSKAGLSPPGCRGESFQSHCV